MEDNLLVNARSSYLRKEELLVLINSLDFDRVKYFKLDAITGYRKKLIVMEMSILILLVLKLK